MSCYSKAQRRIVTNNHADGISIFRYRAESQKANLLFLKNVYAPHCFFSIAGFKVKLQNILLLE